MQISGFWATVSKTVCPMLSFHCLSVLSVCNFGVLWPNRWTDQDETRLTGRPRTWPHCVRWGPSSPPLNPPIFGPYLLWPNRWMDRGCTWHGGRPQPRRLCVRWGPSLLPKRAEPSPQFSAHFCCGQMAGRIKMALSMEVGLGPGHIVLDW